MSSWEWVNTKLQALFLTWPRFNTKIELNAKQKFLPTVIIFFLSEKGSVLKYCYFSSKCVKLYEKNLIERVFENFHKLKPMIRELALWVSSRFILSRGQKIHPSLL